MNTLFRPVVLLCTLAFAGCQIPEPPAPNSNVNGPARCGEGGPRWPADHLKIAYRHWPAQGHVRGVIAAMPGWDSDACDWAPLARGLAARGYEVYVTGRRSQWGDPRVYRGDDLAKAARGDLHNWRVWAEDYAAFTRWVAARHPRQPLIYGAQSMGTGEVLNVAGDPAWHGAPARGIFIISPPFPFMYPNTKSALVVYLGPLFLDQNYRIADVDDMRKNNVQLMNDPAEWLRWSHSSDRVREGFTVRWLGQAAHLGIAAREAAKHIDQPIFVYHGGNDELVNDKENAALTDPNAWKLFQAELHAPVTPYFLPNGNHLPFPDHLEGPQIIAHLTRWLDQTVATVPRERNAKP